MDEGFQPRHLTGHLQELLGGSDIQLHGVSGKDEVAGLATL
jgi:hypothetical protein